MTILLIILAIIVLIVIGGAVIGFALKLLWWALLGLLIGALARLLIPGRQAMGWLATALVGIGGALLGGIVADALDTGGFVQFLIAVAVAALLVEALAGGWRGIQRVMVGGEALPADLQERFFARSRAALWNQYGPTEATVGCMVHRYDALRDRRVATPIGRAAPNRRARPTSSSASRRA